MQGRGVDITDALVAAILLKYGNMEIWKLSTSKFLSLGEPEYRCGEIVF